MLNFGQMATVFNSWKVIKGENNATATAELIIAVYGQVQAFASESATDMDIARQIVSTIEHLNKIREEVDISKSTLQSWAWRFVNNEVLMPRE